MTYRYRLNADEAVTVRLMPAGGGKIWIRARKPGRSPLNVVSGVLRRARSWTPAHDALEEHALEVACSSPKTYREEISWPGSP